MKENVPVNFETYYFWELLNAIEARGKEQYGNNELNYLQRFLSTLRQEEDAFQNITRLAGSSTTSDFAIFFNDILDRIRNLDPTDAFKKIEEYAQDFLETFGLLMEEGDWKSALAEELNEPVEAAEKATAEPAAAPEVPAEVTATGEEAVSYTDFVYQTVMEAVERHTADQPVERQAAILEFFQRNLTRPEFTDLLLEQELDPQVPEWTDVLATVLDENPQIPFDQNWLANFNEKVQQLVKDGIALYQQHAEAIDQLLAGKRPVQEEVAPEKAAAPSEEPPLEAAFESIEFSEEEPSEGPDNPELEELIEKAEALEKQKKPTTGEMSEEELKRRRLLRDYVVGEVDGFREEVVHLIERLIQDPQQEKLRKYLVDSIKALKDLGKIHNYPAIELIADRLASILQSGREFKQAILGDLDNLFKLMREYVDANLNDADAPVMNEITRALESLESHAETEALPLSGADAASVKKAFFEIVRRYLGRLNTLAAEALQQGDTTQQQRFEKIVQNIRYWAQSLNLTAPLEFAQILETVTTTTPLTKEAFTTVQSTLEQLAAQSELENERVWQEAGEALQQLAEAPAEAPETPAEVGIGEAGEAIQDVVVKQLKKLRAALEGATDLTAFVEKDLIPALNSLIENLKLAGYETATAVIQELLSKTLEWLAAVPPRKEGLEQLLHYLIDHANELPEGWDVTLALEHLQQAFPVEQLTTELEEELESPVETPAEDTGEATPTESVDIDAVFHQEAQKYCDQLREMLTRLQNQVEDIELWKDFTVEAHTLKGSSQMLGKMVIARLATVLEELSEAVEEGKLSPGPAVLEVLTQGVDAIQQVLNGELVDPQPVEEAGRQLLESPEAVSEEPTPAEGATEEEAVESAKPSGTDAAVEEGPEIVAPQAETARQKDEETYLYLKEQDPELLAIFQNEAVENLDLIQATVANLEKFTYDKKAFQDVEQAVHELHTSAKMLGFKEIGKVAELLEKLVEKITSRELENWRDALRFIRRGGVVIQELMKSGRVERQQYHTIVQEIEQILESGFIPTEEGIPEAPAEEVPTEPATPEVAPEVETTPSAPAEAEPAAGEEKVQNQVIELFLQEAIEKLEEINFALIKLEDEPDNAELQQQLMRSFHTLKGSASIVHATHVEQLTHLSEDIIEYYRQHQQALPADFIDTLFRVADEINYITQALQQFQEERTSKFDELI